MLRATSIVRKPLVKADKVIDTVTLDHEGRHKRRIALKGDGGLDLLLDLDKTMVLNDGDAVKLEDGRLVAIKAAPQKLLEIRAENPLRLMRVGWHIGNRHTPAEITADAIYIEDDHVLAEMVRGRGCSVTSVERPFKPEQGAYEQDCGHDHSHDHAHDHANHNHSAQAQDHVHGPDCGHEHHDHGHKHDHDHKHDHGHAHGHKHDH